MTDDAGYWCRSCRVTTDDLDDAGSPRDWYRIQLKKDGYGADDLRPGWYCSPGCVTQAGMIALGVPVRDAVAWLRG